MYCLNLFLAINSLIWFDNYMQVVQHMIFISTVEIYISLKLARSKYCESSANIRHLNVQKHSIMSMHVIVSMDIINHSTNIHFHICSPDIKQT